ncbi:MAG: TonB-dependent receptor [Ignavibacteriaceae bacterium]
MVLSTSYAQDFTLRGRVSDAFSGKPVQSAIVFISYANMAYTNSQGEYVINNLDKGNYEIRVSHISYKSFNRDAVVSNDTEINFSLEPSPIELDEVIVSTSRFDKYLRNSPYSELMIKQSQVESKPFHSLPDILKKEPGISVINDGVWGTEISIRGLNRENIVALIDGNRVATSTDVAARFSMVDVNDIERIEIIKGASSSIYGSGATGGIINIVTKSPEFRNSFSLGGSINTGYNSVNNSSVTSGSVSGGGSIWSSKISGSYRKAGNISTPAGELENSQFEDYSFSGSLNVVPVRNHLFRINYQLFKAVDVGIPGASVFPNTADVRYPDERRELISGAYDIQNISKLLYKLSFKYSHQEIERNVENIPHIVQNIPATETTPARRVSVLKITPEAEHRNNNILLQGNFLLSENNNLILGFDYWDRSYNGNRERHQLIEVLNPQGNVINTTNRIIGEKPLPDSKFKSYGIFAQDDAELIEDKLSVSIGARIDKIDISGETTLNPIYEITNGIRNDAPAGQKIIWNKISADENSYSTNIGLKYSLNRSLDLTLSAGYAFRSPSLEERFQYIDQGSYVRIGNPLLEPERVKSADLGIRYYISNIKIVSSFFFNYFNNLITEIPGTFEDRNAFIKTNIGEARLYGFDLNTEYNFYKDFVFHFTSSYVKGEDVTADGSLPEIPPLKNIIGLRFIIFDMIQTDVSSAIYAAQNNVAEGETATGGYTLFDLSFNTKNINISSYSVKFMAGIENIFNKHYRDHLSTTRGNILVGPGRNFYLKVLTSIGQ